MSASLFAPRRPLAPRDDPQAPIDEIAPRASRDRASPRSAASARSAAAGDPRDTKDPSAAKTSSARVTDGSRSPEGPRRASSRSSNATKNAADPKLEAAATKNAADPRADASSKGAGDTNATGARTVHGYAREAAALLLLASALYTSLALASFRGDPMRSEIVGADWVGPVGALLAGALVSSAGMCAWLVPIDLALFAGPLLQGRKMKVTLVRVAGDLVVLVVAAALLHVAFPKITAFGEMPLGGYVGELFGEVMRALFSTLGSYIVGLTVVSLILIGRAAFSIIDWAQRAERRARALRDRGEGGLRALVGAWDQAREIDEKRREEERRAGAPVITETCDEAIVAALADDSPLPFPKVKPLVPAMAGDVGGMAFASVAESGGLLGGPTGLARAGVLLGGAVSFPAAAPTTGTVGNAARAARAEAPTPTPAATRAERAAKTRTKKAAADAPAAGPIIFGLHASLDPGSADAAVTGAGTVTADAAGSITGGAAGSVTGGAVGSITGGAAGSVTGAAQLGGGVAGAGVDDRDGLEIRLTEGSPQRPDSTSSASFPSPPPASSSPDDLDRADDADEDEDSDGSDDAPVAPLPPRAATAAFPPPAPAPAAAARVAAPAPAAPVAAARVAAPALATASARAPALAGPVAAPAASAPVAKKEPPPLPPAPTPPPPDPVIVDTSAASKAQKPAEIVRVVPSWDEGFRLPSTDMLEAASEGRVAIDTEHLRQTAVQLEKVLADYGVSGKVEEIHPGPTVTTFEVSPAAGTKVSKVASLADDLALGLSRKVRIVAPIPGKNRIGFEVPNDRRVPVVMRELVEDKRFLEMKAPLPCVLGRDIIGAPFFADLASMPHVIVAGATGAGKSVGLNVMLISLLYRRTPAELRLLMIDPKVVELAPFDGIPHMLLPVVTDMKQASNALKWAVDEMERRYQLFANAGTRNITSYNGWAERVQRGEIRAPKKTQPAKVAAVSFDGTEVEVDAAGDGSDAELPEKLPFIVIVVDEFADLMMQQGKEVEASVARLAQKARAAGMHVILATQRPSVDVITGMIKANFPTRIAFRVAQKVDSRTILDEQGAEHLLGRGDMLVRMNGSNDTRRVQCPFCTEEEVQRVTDFLRLQGTPVYDENILKPRDEDGEVESGDDEMDAMYDAAVRVVADTRRCSTSWLQRKLGIGYNRAAKMVEAMEKRGVVGPANGAKEREVLIGTQ